MILEPAATAATLLRAGTPWPQCVRTRQDNHNTRTRVEQAMSRQNSPRAPATPAITAILLLLLVAGCSVLAPPSPSADSDIAAQAGAALTPGAGQPPAAATPAVDAAPVPGPTPAPATASEPAPEKPVLSVKTVPTGSTAPKPAAPATQNGAAGKPGPKAAKTPSKPAVATSAPAAKPPAAAPAPVPLALSTLEQRLKDTPAIGVFTKITLKNQVDDLLERFRSHYEGRGGTTLPQLRQNYDALLQKVIGLLRGGDPALAAAITGSREAIWNVLTDPAKFAKL